MIYSLNDIMHINKHSLGRYDVKKTLKLQSLHTVIMICRFQARSKQKMTGAGAGAERVAHINSPPPGFGPSVEAYFFSVDVRSQQLCIVPLALALIFFRLC